MEPFAKMLQNKSQLRILGLEYNRINTYGIQHVLDSLVKLTEFERLFVNNNHINEDCGEALFQFLTKCESLTTIRLSQNPLCEEGGCRVADALL